jgi:integration host factor subunit alpha
MALTKAEIVSRICEKNRISNPEIFNVVQATFEVIKASLERGEKVKIKNFGNFAVRTKHRRRGRNPKTGEEIVISGRKVLTFTASPATKKKVNSASSAQTPDADWVLDLRHRWRPSRAASLLTAQLSIAIRVAAVFPGMA